VQTPCWLISRTCVNTLINEKNVKYEAIWNIVIHLEEPHKVCRRATKYAGAPQFAHHCYKPTWLTTISSHWSMITVSLAALSVSLSAFNSYKWQRSGLSELQAHHCILLEQWTWLKCSVSVWSSNKLSLHELTQLIRIKLLISRFLEIFASVPISRGANARFAPPAYVHGTECVLLPCLTRCQIFLQLWIPLS